MEGTEENRAALLMGLDMLTNLSYVDEVGRLAGAVIWHCRSRSDLVVS